MFFLRAISLALLMFLPFSAVAESLFTGKIRYDANCFGLTFSDPDFVDGELKFDGRSSVGPVKMDLGITDEKVFINLKGAKVSNVKYVVDEEDTYHKVRVRYLHDEGVCNYSFPLFGLHAIVEKEEEKDLNEIDQKIDAARKFKTICEEIGFTPDTEAFGNCVLRLIED